MKKLISVLLVCVLLFGVVLFTVEGVNAIIAKTAQSQESSNTSGSANSDTDSMSLGIKMSDLSDLMQPIFSGNTVKNETVMFLDKGDIKTLLFPIESVISVTSYDGTIVYQEGVDYSIIDGKIKVLENSSIPCITRDVYYNQPNTSKLVTNYKGEAVYTYWGENLMDEWQVNVNYTHSSKWTGFKQDCQSDIFSDFIKKLENGEDVTVFFSGDSITNGATSSFLGGYAPYQHSYPMLFTEALADLYDYTVKYINVTDNTKLLQSKVAPVPDTDYVAGTRGTITYINTAIGGWTSTDGKDNVQNYIIDYINNYGCDLIVLAYGMNDGANPTETRTNLQAIADTVLRSAPKTSIAFITTMVCNPADMNRPAAAKANQRGEIKNLAKNYCIDGVPCGVADMGSVSLSVLTRKAFHDYSGNNINHPNDFFGRVYAQTLLQAVIGYENMN